MLPALSLILSTDSCRRKNDFFRGSKRTNWFESFLTLSQSAIICQNPWHTWQRKNKRFVARNTRGETRGGGFCIHKRPWTRFSLQLTFTLTLQPSTLVALFTSHYFCHCFAGVLWWFMAIFQLQFCGFLLSSVFVGIAQRESCLCTLVWCWCQPGFFPLCPVFTVF